MKKELMRRIVNVTKNKVIFEEIVNEENIFPSQLDVIQGFLLNQNCNSKMSGYKEYNSHCFEYINSDKELVLEYIMWFIV